MGKKEEMCMKPGASWRGSWEKVTRWALWWGKEGAKWKGGTRKMCKGYGQTALKFDVKTHFESEERERYCDHF